MAPRPLVIRRTKWRPGVVFFGAFVMPLVAWALYNVWEVPLRPEAQALIDAQPEKLPEAENLFLALLAFPISGEERAHERGAAALAAAAAQPAAPAQEPSRTYAELMGRMSARVDEQGARPCVAGNKEGAYHCLRDSRAQRAAFAPLLSSLAPLLLRYRELELYPRYADPRALLPDLAPDATAYHIALLNLSVIALAMDEGAVEPAIGALSRSAAIWRRVMAARDVGLIDEMLALRAYEAHLLFVSELIRERPQVMQGAAADAIDAILLPMSDAERSLAGPLASEFRLQAQMWTQITDPNGPIVREDFPDTSSWWYRLLAKRNDSINRSYADLERILAVERRGCEQVREQVQAVADEKPSYMRWYEWFYNPIGRVLHDSINPSEQLLGYLGRQCNLLALQRMVSLQAESARSGRAPEALLSGFPDPNTGAPFRYDAAQGTLGFAYIGRDAQFVTPLPLRAAGG
jgi:hypothetical protein